jgi:hypothetical protein
MIQIPAPSVAQMLANKFNKRIYMSLGSKGFAMQQPSGNIGTFISNVTIALAQLMSEMLKDTDEGVESHHENDDANVSIFLSAMDTPEFQRQHKVRLNKKFYKKFYIVHQGRLLYEFEYS